MQRTELFRLTAAGQETETADAADAAEAAQFWDAKADFADFARFVTAAPETRALEERQAQAAADRERLAALNVWSHGIDLRLRCSKTGQPCGTVDALSATMLLDMKGPALAAELIAAQCLAKTNVARHWVFTGPEQLDYLSRVDPTGYFIYSAHNIIGRQDQVKAWTLLDALSIPYAEVMVYNDILRKYNAIMPSGAGAFLFIPKFRHNNLAEVCETKGSIECFFEDLQSNMVAYITKAVRKGALHGQVTYADVMQLKSVSKPNSQFRLQAKPQAETETDFIRRIIDDVATAEGVKYLSTLTGLGPTNAEMKAARIRLRGKNQIFTLQPGVGINIRSAKAREAAAFLDADAFSGISVPLSSDQLEKQDAALAATAEAKPASFADALRKSLKLS